MSVNPLNDGEKGSRTAPQQQVSGPLARYFRAPLADVSRPADAPRPINALPVHWTGGRFALCANHQRHTESPARAAKTRYRSRRRFQRLRARRANSTRGERPRIGQETRASHVRVWVTQEVDLLGRTQLNKSALVSRFRAAGGAFRGCPAARMPFLPQNGPPMRLPGQPLGVVLGSIARHDNQLEVRIELDLVLLSVLAFHVVDFIAKVCLLNLAAVQPKISMVALIFSASAGDTGVSASAKVLPLIIPAANAIRTNFIFIPPALVCAPSGDRGTELAKLISKGSLPRR